MQKLMRSPHRGGRDNHGSALVSAVALALIMVIGCIGFIWLMTTSHISEITALENERAYRAAESGVWVGARWLRNPANGFGAIATPVTLKPFGANPITIDSLDVYLAIPVRMINGIPVAQIIAEAFLDPSGSHQKTSSTFRKRITVNEVRIQNFGAYCTFYDAYQSPFTEGTTIAQWHGWFGRTFNGRFHMNNMYNEIAGAGAPGNGANSVVFNGPVSIGRPTDPVVLSHYTNNYSTLYGGRGHFGNNYDKGVWVEDAASTGGVWPNLTAAALDQAFLDRYVADVDPISLNTGRTDATAIRNDNTIPATDKIDLPVSARDDGYGPTQYRPTLYFNGATAYYEYKSGANYKKDTISNFNGRILCSDNNLNIYSTAGVTGKVTIATIPGKSIVPVGNIVTSDYNPALGENAIPISSNNMIGLISGQYIYFNKTWIKHFNTDWADNTEYVSSRVTGGGSPGPSDGNGTLHISASIIATKTFTKVYNGNNYTMKGCEFWDGWWDISNCHAGYSSTFTDVNCHLQDYSYQLFGNHILGGYVNTIGDHDRFGCNGTLEFNPDQRMVKKFEQPPGFPMQVITQTGLFNLELANWTETNTL